MRLRQASTFPFMEIRLFEIFEIFLLLIVAESRCSCLQGILDRGVKGCDFLLSLLFLDCLCLCVLGPGLCFCVSRRFEFLPHSILLRLLSEVYLCWCQCAPVPPSVVRGSFLVKFSRSLFLFLLQLKIPSSHPIKRVEHTCVQRHQAGLVLARYPKIPQRYFFVGARNASSSFFSCAFVFLR